MRRLLHVNIAVAYLPKKGLFTFTSLLDNARGREQLKVFVRNYRKWGWCVKVRKFDVPLSVEGRQARKNFRDSYKLL